MEETGQQEDAVGANTIVLSGVHRQFDARNTESSVLRLREAATDIHHGFFLEPVFELLSF